MPSQDGVRSEFGAVVADQRAGIAPRFGEVIEFADDTQSGERGVYRQAEALPREVIDHGEDAESPPAYFTRVKSLS